MRYSYSSLFLSPRNCWLLVYLYINMFFLLSKNSYLLSDRKKWIIIYGRDCDVTCRRQLFHCVIKQRKEEMNWEGEKLIVYLHFRL